jgi:hypothetical protein
MTDETVSQSRDEEAVEQERARTLEEEVKRKKKGHR